jgi:S1-C subfamily serine protease
MRKSANVFFTTLHALLCVGFAFSQDKPVSVETIERIKSAAAPVVCGAPDEAGTFHVKGILGSGFFINNEGYFLTAAHVVSALESVDTSQAQCFPAIYISIGGWQTVSNGVHWFRFDECIKDATADIAVCKPKINPFGAENVKRQMTFVSFATALNLKDGTALAFTGFPLNLLRPVTSKANLATYLELDKKIVIDKTAWHGASGSPLYLWDGGVVGIMIETGTGEAGGLAFARPSEFITEFLTKNKIRFYQQKQK